MKNDLAVFKACADETRLRILFLLSEGELCVCEIVAVLDMPQGKISRHLSVLKHAGLVSDRRNGIWIYYSLAEPGTALKRLLGDYLAQERERHVTVVEDLKRLNNLACNGQICIPNPSPATGISRN